MRKFPKKAYGPSSSLHTSVFDPNWKINVVFSSVGEFCKEPETFDLEEFLREDLVQLLLANLGDLVVVFLKVYLNVLNIVFITYFEHLDYNNIDNYI